jgi:hypothetical protein
MKIFHARINSKLQVDERIISQRLKKLLCFQQLREGLWGLPSFLSSGYRIVIRLSVQQPTSTVCVNT